MREQALCRGGSAEGCRRDTVSGTRFTLAAARQGRRELQEQKWEKLELGPASKAAGSRLIPRAVAVAPQSLELRGCKALPRASCCPGLWEHQGARCGCGHGVGGALVG